VESDIVAQVLLWALGIGAVLGAVANKTNFCVMGAVSDLVNIGDLGRLRAWLLAIAVAMGGVLILESTGVVDMSLTADGETSNPPYRMANFVWLRYLLGGFLFGIGMTLASGCGNKTLVRLGGGNMKAVVVLACVAAGAYPMLFTDFFYLAFFQWMAPLSVDLALLDIDSQDLGSLAAGFTENGSAEIWRLALGVAIAALLLIFVFKSRDFWRDADNLGAGVIVGLLVLAGWYVTAGSLGQTLLEEVDFMDERPYAVGAQSLTFIAPAGHAVQYALQGFARNYLTFGLTVFIGVALGSFLYALLAKRLRLEWFSSWRDFGNHVVGGLLMGVGGVLGLGCTIGQGITGNSTLALGSFLTTVAIVFGSALTMKYQYYRMLYEDASSAAAILSSLVDMRLLPARLRKLEAL